MHQNTGLRRNVIDKYYTKTSIVSLCMENIISVLQIDTNDCLIEPSAGGGAFIGALQSLSKHCYFYDIAPENDAIVKQDFLSLDQSTVWDKYDKVHIIGNPPFGRQSSMAIKFIKKACGFGHSVSFILPKSFKKESLKRAFPANFHLLREIDIPCNAFLVDGAEHDVPCIMQVWLKRDYVRDVVCKLEPMHFAFVKKSEEPDISFRRVGVNAGKMSIDVDEKSEQSHYFIKFTNNRPLSENLEQLSKITYAFDNTVGPKSISKQELIAHFNPCLSV
jgi:hypothetical protein